MQKILLVLLLILTTTSANATQMCARRDTTVIPLDASISYNNKRQAFDVEWWGYQIYDFGNVYIIGTCLSLPEIEQYIKITAGIPMILPTDIDELQGRSGDYIASDGTVYPRQYCYGKVVHPMSSQWAYRADYQTSAGCNQCAGSMGAVLLDTRRAYPTIGIGYTEINTKEYDESIDLN